MEECTDPQERIYAYFLLYNTGNAHLNYARIFGLFYTCYHVLFSLIEQHPKRSLKMRQLLERAVAYFHSALKINQRAVEAHFNLAVTLAKSARTFREKKKERDERYNQFAPHHLFISHLHIFQSLCDIQKSAGSLTYQH